MNPMHPNQFSSKQTGATDITKVIASGTTQEAAAAAVWPSTLAGWQQDLLVQLALS